MVCKQFAQKLVLLVLHELINSHLKMHICQKIRKMHLLKVKIIPTFCINIVAPKCFWILKSRFKMPEYHYIRIQLSNQACFIFKKETEAHFTSLFAGLTFLMQRDQVLSMA